MPADVNSPSSREFMLADFATPFITILKTYRYKKNMTENVSIGAQILFPGPPFIEWRVRTSLPGNISGTVTAEWYNFYVMLPWHETNARNRFLNVL